MDFTNIVDQGEQHPLHIYLGFRPQGKVVQAFLYVEFAKTGSTIASRLA
ncbi:MAG TPA: hypothetical protein VLA72_23015 [Anaerolineales bacterium]|nr:hypothetical protein [Anaerolineales bacterium]